MIVHGLGEHSGRYTHVADRLVGTGWSVVAFDQQGHGRTAGRRGHAAYESLLDDIELARKTACEDSPEKPCYLYGHSLGGNLVLNSAFRRTGALDGLIVTSPLLRPALRIPYWQRKLARLLKQFWPGLLLKSRIDPLWLSHVPEAVAAYHADPLIHGRVSCQLGVEMLDAGEYALEHAAMLELPILLMHGDADPLTSVEATREFARRTTAPCTLRIWEGMAHELHWERVREQVLTEIVEWLDSQAARPPGCSQPGSLVDLSDSPE